MIPTTMLWCPVRDERADDEAGPPLPSDIPSEGSDLQPRQQPPGTPKRLETGIDGTYEPKSGEHSHDAMSHVHFLDQLQKRGFYDINIKAQEDGTGEQKSPAKTKLYVTLVVSAIRGIDASEGSFTARTRLYLFQPVQDPAALKAFDEFAEKHRETGGLYYALDGAESEKCLAVMDLPIPSYLNEMQSDAVDVPGVRVYGSHGGAIMWNCAYVSKFQEHFELKEFPFDVQDLSMKLSLNSSRTWDKFDLCVHEVIFNKEALELAEWDMYAPVIHRDSEKSTTITLKVGRKSYYYISNIFGLLLILGVCTLFVFAVPADELADRLSLILTLLLTVVAFKFVIADVLPKVSYSTFIDTFLLRMYTFYFLTAMVVTGQSIVGDGRIASAHIALAMSVVFVTSMGGWTFTVWRVLQQNSKQRILITPEPDTNWYNFRFGFPYFLPPRDA